MPETFTPAEANSALAEARANAQQTLAPTVSCGEQLEELGVRVKDLDLGILDVPGHRAGSVTELSRHAGDEGYTGRKPIGREE